MYVYLCICLSLYLSIYIRMYMCRQLLRPWHAKSTQQRHGEGRHHQIGSSKIDVPSNPMLTDILSLVRISLVQLRLFHERTPTVLWGVAKCWSCSGPENESGSISGVLPKLFSIFLKVLISTEGASRMPVECRFETRDSEGASPFVPINHQWQLFE